MYTIFFTINCVEQLTFSKTFVDQLQFEQLIFFCLKVKLLEKHVWQMIFYFQPVDKISDICSNGVEQMKDCVDHFFEQMNFKQLIMTPSTQYGLLNVSVNHNRI
jgi:hypothetical protein